MDRRLSFLSSQQGSLLITWSFPPPVLSCLVLKEREGIIWTRRMSHADTVLSLWDSWEGLSALRVEDLKGTLPSLLMSRVEVANWSSFSICHHWQPVFTNDRSQSWQPMLLPLSLFTGLSEDKIGPRNIGERTRNMVRHCHWCVQCHTGGVGYTERITWVFPIRPYFETYFGPLFSLFCNKKGNLAEECRGRYISIRLLYSSVEETWKSA